MFVQKSYDPVKLEKLGLELKDDVVKEKGTGTVVPESDSRIKNIMTSKINWSWVGPAVAIVLFVLGWATVVSERAYTATVNSDKIEQQTVSIEKQDVQIDELKKANERHEIMVKEQMQILDKQDKVMETREKYSDKRLDAIERDVVNELRSLRLEMKELKSEISELRKGK